MICIFNFHGAYRRHPCSWYRQHTHTTTTISCATRAATTTGSRSRLSGIINNNAVNRFEVNLREIIMKIQTETHTIIERIHKTVLVQSNQQEQQQPNDNIKDELLYSTNRTFQVVLETLIRYRDCISPLYKLRASSKRFKHLNHSTSPIYHQMILFEEYCKNAKLVYDTFEESVITLEKNNIVASHPRLSKIYYIRQVMMDLYGSIGSIAKVEEIFLKSVETTTEETKEQATRVMDALLLPNNHNIKESYHVLIQAYGKCKLPHRAEEIVQQLLVHHPDSKSDVTAAVRIDIIMLNILLNCIAELTTPSFEHTQNTTNGESSHSQNLTTSEATKPHPSIWNRGHNLMNFIKSSSYCQKYNIRPDSVTYTILLKCLCSTLSSTDFDSDAYGENESKRDVGAKVETILREVEERSFVKGDKSCQPTTSLYNVAIKALLLAKDYSRAKNLLRRMEHNIFVRVNDTTPDIRPDVYTYITFLKYYYHSTKSSDDANGAKGANGAQSILNHMRRISQRIASRKKKDSRPFLSLKPTVPTYRIVMKLWVSSNDPNTTTHLWSLYEQMTGYDENLVPTYPMYVQLVDSLSSSKRVADKRRAVLLLLQNNHDSIQYDDGTKFLTALRNFMSQQDISFTAEVVKLYVESFISNSTNKIGLFMTQKRFSRLMFNYVITSHIANNEHVSATFFLCDILEMATKAITTMCNDDDPLDVSWIGPDVNVALDLRKEWDRHPHLSSEKKEYIVNQFDNFIIPTLVRFVNIEKQNTDALRKTIA